MKKFSKILSVALLVALVLSLGVASAFAADPTPAAASPDYSITVTNGIKDETYKAFKMFDLLVDNPTNPTAFTYTVNEDWSGFVSDPAFTAAFEIVDGYVKAKAAATSENDWVAGSVMSELGEAAAKYAKDHNIAAKATETPTANGDVKLVVGEAGYYVISSTLGSRAMIQTTPAASAVTVIEKNDGDTIDKEVQEDSTSDWGDENDAQVGDTVHFHSVAHISARSINVKIHDTMDAGLTLLPETIKVYTDAAYSTEYDKAVIHAGTGDNAPDSGDTFTIIIPDSFAATAENSQDLYVKYDAVLNEGAIATDSDGNIIVENNKTKVTFGDHSTSNEDHTETTTHKFEIKKHNASNELLAGAKFKLYSLVSEAVAADQDAGTEAQPAVYAEVKVVKIDDTNYRVAKSNENGVEIVTVTSGNIVVWGVDSDTYYLEETEAPSGYNKIEGKIPVEVNKANTYEADVLNQTGSVLPSTGGIGTTIFYVVGGVLVLAAIILLVTKKRMSE